VSATGQETTAPAWQKHLEGVHVPRKGRPFKGSEGEKTKEAILRAYTDKGGLREIASFLRRSYGSVRNVVSDARILRSRGGVREITPGFLTPRERAEKSLRDLIASEAYEPHHKLPPLKVLVHAAGVSRTTLVRAALTLQSENLLLLVPGRGYVAIDPSDPPKGDTLQVCVHPGRWEMWLIDNQNGTNAVYLKKAIMGQIQGGTWPPGSRVPSQASIANRFGTPQTAVQSALRSLEKHGQLVRKKKFLFVPDSPSLSPPAPDAPPCRTGAGLSPRHPAPRPLPAAQGPRPQRETAVGQSPHDRGAAPPHRAIPD